MSIIIDGVHYKSIKEVIKKYNLPISPSSLYKYLFRYKKQISSGEITALIDKIKSRDKKDYINLGDVIYDLIHTSDNFEEIEDFLLSMPIYGTDSEFFIEYITANYNKAKDSIPTKITLDFLLEVLDYYFKDQLHPDLTNDTENRKAKKVNNKRLNDYSKEYGLSYGIVWTIYNKSRDADNPDEEFMKLLEEKVNSLVKNQPKN